MSSVNHSNGPGRAVVISGPSGSGKSTIGRRLRQDPRVVFSVSCTTRAPRPGEEHGVHYLFVDEQEFRGGVASDRFLEWAEVYGNLYGTPRDPLDEAVHSGKVFLLEIDVQGALQVRERLPEALFIFIDVPDDAELRRRLEGRGTETREVVERRLAKARAEREQRGAYDHVVVNDDAERAYRETCALIGIEPRADDAAQG
jgi:guanylate kinase